MRQQIFALIAFAFLLGCQSNGTSTGNPLVEIKLDGYTAPAKVQGKIAIMSISSLKLCFKRLRFKTASESTNADPSLDEDNIDLSLGEVTITPAGSSLTSVTVPEGTYTRVEFDLESNCGSGQSIEVTNSHGTFKTSSRTTIKFDGTFTAANSAEILTLNIQNLVDAMNNVTADSSVRSAAEGVSGSF